MSWDVVVGYLSGLSLIDPNLRGEVLLRTVVVVHILDAIMCRLLAHNNGRQKNLWTVLGLLFGIWTLAVLMVLPKRSTADGQDLG